jgi:hypothetical protein
VGKIKDLNYPIASTSIARINNDLHKIGKIETRNKLQLKIRYEPYRAMQADHVWYLFIALPNWFSVISEK